MRILFIALVCALASLAGCNIESKKASGYKGDGKIEYLPAPLMGISGWKIELPSFALTEKVEETYSLAGLPEGQDYVVYLVIPAELPPEISEVTFSSRVMQGGKILKELPPKKISEMINTNSSPQDNNFYFINRDPKLSNDIDYIFDVNKGTTPLSLTISIYNPYVRLPISAYMKIERGGFK